MQKSSIPKSTLLTHINWRLLPVGERILLAVSGGADSIAMLHAARTIDENGENLVVGHINHGTRGAENAEDAHFVESLCRKWGIDFCVKSLHIENHSEATLRAARYEALLKMAHQYKCARIATAHTASDVLEGVLLHFLRDASILGWSGISAQRPLDTKVLLVRPLLQTSREEVRLYLRECKQEWREDSSNESTFYKRNALRHQLMPVLHQLVPQGLHQLAKQTERMTRIARDENDFLEEQIQCHWDKILIEESPQLLIWNGRYFAQLHPAIQRRLLRRAALHFCDRTNNLDFARVEEVRHHIQVDGRNCVWQWRDGISIHWTGPGSGRRIRIRFKA